MRTLSLNVHSNEVADDGEQIQRVNDVLMVFEKARQKWKLAEGLRLILATKVHSMTGSLAVSYRALLEAQTNQLWRH